MSPSHLPNWRGQQLLVICLVYNLIRNCILLTVTGCGGGTAPWWAALPAGSATRVLSGGRSRSHAVPQTLLPLHHGPKGECERSSLTFCTWTLANTNLFCPYQGVVSGILLVTSNKIFFDPCKTLPLVKEHGCEEYLLSCSVDSLLSVSFFSDISHVHFSTSQQRSVAAKRLMILKMQLQKSYIINLIFNIYI